MKILQQLAVGLCFVFSISVEANQWESLSVDVEKLTSPLHYQVKTEMKTAKSKMTMSATYIAKTRLEDGQVILTDILDFGKRASEVVISADIGPFFTPNAITAKNISKGEVKKTTTAVFDGFEYDLTAGDSVEKKTYPAGAVSMGTLIRLLPQVPKDESLKMTFDFAYKSMKKPFISEGDVESVALTYHGNAELESFDNVIEHFVLTREQGHIDYYVQGNSVVLFKEGGSTTRLMNESEVKEFYANKEKLLKEQKAKEEKKKRFAADAYEAIKEGNVKAFKKLYKGKTFEVRFPIKFGKAPLLVAAEFNQPKIIELILKYGENVNRRGKYNRTALHAAVRGNAFEAVKVLVKHGADIETKDAHGLTPLTTSKRLQGRNKISKYLEGKS